MSIHEKIKDILTQHLGKENAISSVEIANQLGIDAGSSKVTIRRKIKETMIKHELPFSLTSKGYYLMEDDDEDLKRYQRSLAKRAYEDMERSFLVTKFFNKYYSREELEWAFIVIINHFLRFTSYFLIFYKDSELRSFLLPFFF